MTLSVAIKPVILLASALKKICNLFATFNTKIRPSAPYMPTNRPKTKSPQTAVNQQFEDFVEGGRTRIRTADPLLVRQML